MRLWVRTPTSDSTTWTPGAAACSSASTSKMSPGVRSQSRKVRLVSPVVEAHRRSVRWERRQRTAASSCAGGTRTYHWQDTG